MIMTTMVTPDRAAGKSLTTENQSINIAASLEGEFLGGIYNCTPQSINQCVNQLINHPVHQSNNQSSSTSINRRTNCKEKGILGLD